VEIKQAGEIQIATDVINHSIKKAVKASLLIVNVMQLMSRFGRRKKLLRQNKPV